MRYKVIEEDPKTYALIFETGDDLVAGLQRFVAEQQISGGSFTAIGALSSVTLAWFDWETKQYRVSVDLREQIELLSLAGDIALKDDEPVVHAHVVVGRRDGTAHGGHLQEATVRPTCELILTQTPAPLRKHIDPESGLALIRL